MKRADKIAFVKNILGERGPGLEIGPHVHPMIRKSEGHDVSYLETRSTEQLRNLLVSLGKDPSIVEPIDFVLGRDISLAENVEWRKFDWVLTSHVLEHIPDFVGHLNEVSSVLNANGLYVAYVPDRNLCFDRLKPPSSLGDVLEAFVEGRKEARFSHLIDELRYGARPEGVSVGGWGVNENKRKFVAKYPNWQADVQRALANYPHSTNDWFGHSWKFDPITFTDIVHSLSELNLIDLQLRQVTPTLYMDFLVVFEKSNSVNTEKIDKINAELVGNYRL